MTLNKNEASWIRKNLNNLEGHRWSVFASQYNGFSASDYGLIWQCAQHWVGSSLFLINVCCCVVSGFMRGFLCRLELSSGFLSRSLGLDTRRHGECEDEQLGWSQGRKWRHLAYHNRTTHLASFPCSRSQCLSKVFAKHAMAKAGAFAELIDLHQIQLQDTVFAAKQELGAWMS